MTWPGNSPEGSGWLASLRNLRAGIAELNALWGQAENAGAGDLAAENVITIRSFSSELSAMCLETARKPPLPGANRLALESAAFRLLGLAEVEAGALWQAATSVDTDSKLASAGAVEAWKRGDGKLARLAELLEAILADGDRPVVVDSAVLLKDPGAVLDEVCDQLGLPFEEAMLSWPSGPKPEDGIWARHWYQNTHQSTRFETGLPSTDPLPPGLEAILDEAQPLYDRLAEFSLGPS